MWAKILKYSTVCFSEEAVVETHEWLSGGGNRRFD